jgi:hypothetical protein
MNAELGMMEAKPPQQMQMGAPTAAGAWTPGGNYLDDAPGLVIKQATSECCRTFCCQPNIHFNIHPYKEQLATNEELPTMAFVQEDAPYCGRCWSCELPGFRSTTYTIYGGPGTEEGQGQGPPVMIHSKGCTCPVTFTLYLEDNEVRLPCCCNLPYLDTKDASGTALGKTEYLCDHCLFVPKFGVFNSQGQKMYHIAPDTCCGGCCVEIKCNGKGAKACREPYYIRDPATLEKINQGGDNQHAQISEMWDGLKKECCTLKNTFQVKFPDNATPEMKKTLIGSVLLLDMTYFEGGGNGAYDQG